MLNVENVKLQRPTNLMRAGDAKFERKGVGLAVRDMLCMLFLLAIYDFVSA